MNAGMWGGKLPGGAALGRATFVHICKPCERMCAYLQTVRTNVCIFVARPSAAPPGTGTMLNRAPPSLTGRYNSVAPVRQTPLSPNSGFDALYAAAGKLPAPAPATPGDGA